MRKTLFSLLFLFSGLVFSQTKPIASDVSAAHFKDTNGLIHLVGSDAEFHTLTYTIVTLPTHGTLKDHNNSDAVVSAGGSLSGNSVTFVPHSDENHKYIFSGTNSFTYKVTDSDGDSDTKTVTIKIFDEYLNPPTLIGSEINGEAEGDNFGHAVSFSENGTIMAVGAPNNDADVATSEKGSVRVFQYDGSSWTKIGNDIDGSNDGDEFGASVSLNADGKILAVGIPENDDAFANKNPGQVKIFNYNSATNIWDLIGTINGTNVSSPKSISEQFGHDVRLSSDGKTLAASDIWFDKSGANNAGRVMVYRYDGTNWNSISGELELVGGSGGDNLSWDISLSANGNILAVGIHEDDTAKSNAGKVIIYQYNSSTNSWDTKSTLLGVESNEKFGAAVDLSSDGLIVAVGAPYHRVSGAGDFLGKVSVYKWDGSTYLPLGSDLIGSDKYDYFGSQLSLDNEGNTLAVMGPGHDDTSGSTYLNKGRVRVYNYDTASTSWVQSPASYDFDGEADGDQSASGNKESRGQRVFLSGDGSKIAIGANENDGNGTNSGHVRAYKLFEPQIIPVANSQDVSFTLYEQVTSTEEITLTGTDSDGNDADLVYIITELNTAKLFEGGTEITSSDIPHTLTANKVKYNSNSDVVVNDSFKFIVHDTKASSVPATVTLTIIPDNDPPVVTGQSVTSDEDVAKDIDLAGTDVDNADTNLNFLIYSLPANGTLTDKNNGNSAVTLVTKDSGTTTSANTDKLEDSSQSFTSTVIPGDFLINTTDNTYADIKAVDSDTTLSLSADIMASGEEYTIKRGTSLVVSSGTAKVTYNPNSNYIGSDSFKFKARDKGVADDELTDVENSVDAATVSLTVNNVDNDPPVAEDQTLSTNEETETGTITLVAVDPDLNDTPNPGTPVYEDTSGSAIGVTVVGNYAYVADGASGLAIIDITDKTNPGTPVYKDTSGTARGVTVVGNYAYVADDNSGLAIIDITDKANPGTPIYKDTSGTAWDVSVVGNYAYVADGAFGLAIIDISDKANPGTPVYEDTKGHADEVTVVGNYAYVAVTSAGLAIIDISDPTNPGTPVYEDTSGSSSSVTVVDNYAYVADGPFGLAIIDISNKANPGTPVYKDTSGNASAITVVGNYAYVADVSGLAIIDISDKANPGTPIYKSTSGNASAITVVGNYAYIGDLASGLAIIPLNISSLTYTIASLPTNGKLKDGGTEITAAGDISGALTYLPNTNFSGNDTFKFTAKDDESTPAVSNQATVTINVGNTNDIPSPTAQSVDADEDTEKEITHTGTDPDGDSLTYIIVTLPSKGILKDNGTQIIIGDLPKTLSSNKATYIPEINYNGADSYTFKVFDGALESSSDAKISITVNPGNDKPTADNQSVNTEEEKPIDITLVANDIDGDKLTYKISSLPSNGILKEGGNKIVNSDLPKVLTSADVNYVPGLNYTGNDSFNFFVNSCSVTNQNNTSKLEVTGDFNVSASKTYPMVIPAQKIKGNGNGSEVFKKNVDIKLTLGPGNIFESCEVKLDVTSFDDGLQFDIDGVNLLNFQQKHWDSGAGANTTEFNGNGRFVTSGSMWTPWSGQGNPKLEITSGTIKLMVDTKSGTREDALPFMDSTVADWKLVSSFTYDCLAGFNLLIGNQNGGGGPSAIDADLIVEAYVGPCDDSNIATVSIKIGAVDDPPVANAQTITTNEDTIDAPITLTGTDPESQPLTYIVTALPNNGTLKEGGTAIATVDLPKTLSGNALTYSPEPDYNGKDALTFKVNDGVNESGSAIVSIVVNPVNDPPEADDQTVNTDEDVAVDITHVGRDKDLVNIYTKHTKMGSDINLGDSWGEFIEISADGEIMVVGGWKNNKARVYSWDGTTWNQLGSDIDGSNSGDDFGEFVSISSDGKRIAVGAHLHDSRKGEVRAFDWDGTSWTQVGSAMDGGSGGDESSYRGVHISGDGNVIAAAAFKKGYVDTYKWDGTSWNKTGNISVTAGGGDSPGQVSLSNNGSRLAIGTGGYSGSKGQVKIFDWDGINTWNQYAAIDGKNGGDKFGGTLSISRDGKKVAVGVNGAGSARVYDLSGSNATQVGSDINYGSNSAWRAISLSDDGNRIAIPILDQKIGVFDWDGTKWNQLGEDLTKPSSSPGLWGESIDMSGDGKTLVVGGHTGFIRAHKILNLTYIITSLPSNGILKEGTKTITAADLPFTLKGTDATYVPNTGFSGEDKYNFKVNDGKLDSNIATVTIKIKEFILNLPLSNYTITPTETCKGFDYGIIDIEVAATSYKKTASGADIPITYNIAIEGKGQLATIVSPNKTAQIKDLAEGTHKLVFTVVGQPKYEQKIDVQIIGTDPPVAYAVGKIENCDDDADGDDTNGKVNFATSSILDKLLKNPSTGVLQDKNLFDFEFTYYDEATSTNVTKATLPNPLYSASQTVSVKFKSKINGKCEANQTIDFVVNTLPQIKRIEDTKSVCTNLPPVTIGVTNADNRKYTYTWTRNGTDFPPNITGIDSSILIGLGGEYIVTATTSDGTNCSKSMKITIKESSIATLLRTDIVIKDLLPGPNNTITIKTATLGIGDYEYALDDQTGPYQDEPVFNKVRPGKHTVYVRDKNGCGVVNMDVWVIGYKKFFTPNGDGYTDKWNIIGITKDYQARSKIYIFDRFEKLLKELDPLSPGWDGTFNGKPMPQTDYWFKVILEDGRMFKGHFSLVRAW